MDIYEEGTWNKSGFLHELEECSNKNSVSRTCQCDFVIGLFHIRPNLLDHVSFLPDVGFRRFHIITNQEVREVSKSIDIVFGAFQPAVWGSLFGLVVVFIFLKMMDSRFVPFVPQSRRTQSLEPKQSNHEQQKANRFDMFPTEISSEARSDGARWTFSDGRETNDRPNGNTWWKRTCSAMSRNYSKILKRKQAYRLRKAMQSTGKCWSGPNFVFITYFAFQMPNYWLIVKCHFSSEYTSGIYKSTRRREPINQNVVDKHDYCFVRLIPCTCLWSIYGVSLILKIRSDLNLYELPNVSKNLLTPRTLRKLFSGNKVPDCCKKTEMHQNINQLVT